MVAPLTLANKRSKIIVKSNERKTAMEQKKLLHPSVDVLRVDGTDKEALEFAMVILHEIGWFVQQDATENAISFIRECASAFPDFLVRAGAHGAAVLHKTLGRTVSEP